MLLPRLRRPKPVPRSAGAEPFLAVAAEKSGTFGHDYVGTEHVLLAIAEDSGTRAAQALARLGLTPEVIRRDIERIIGTCLDSRRRAIDPDALATLGIDLDEVMRRVEESFGPGALDIALPDRLGAGGCRPVAPRLKQALELAVREAGDRPLHAERVLVSLAAVEDGVAARILADHGVTAATLRAATSGAS